MKKKYSHLILLGAALLIVLSAVLYPKLGQKIIESRIDAFLAADGYTHTEIAQIDVRHSYIGGILGYGQWQTSIFFQDEPGIEYQCIFSRSPFPNIIQIRAAGFSTELPENYMPAHYP